MGRKAVAVGVLSALLLPAAAFATPTQYDLNGLLGLHFNSNTDANDFRLVFGYGGEFDSNGNNVGNRAFEDYNFTLNPDGTGTLEGTITGGFAAANNVFNPLVLNGNVIDAAVTATFTLNYSGLSVGSDPSAPDYDNGGNLVANGPSSVDAIGRENADGTGTIRLESSLFETDIVITFSLDDKFAFPNGNAFDQPLYGDLGVDPFNLFLGVLPGAAGEEFKAWIMSGAPVFALGDLYTVVGDFHANADAAIPEPASAALLGVALLGGALKRRKQA